MLIWRIDCMFCWYYRIKSVLSAICPVKCNIKYFIMIQVREQNQSISQQPMNPSDVTQFQSPDLSVTCSSLRRPTLRVQQQLKQEAPRESSVNSIWQLTLSCFAASPLHCSEPEGGIWFCIAILWWHRATRFGLVLTVRKREVVRVYWFTMTVQSCQLWPRHSSSFCKGRTFLLLVDQWGHEFNGGALISVITSYHKTWYIDISSVGLPDTESVKNIKSGFGSFQSTQTHFYTKITSQGRLIVLV